MRTVLLDLDTWDLVVGTDGNIAVADDPYSQAQDAASAIRLYQGELWYDTAAGVPYNQILGRSPSIALLKAKMVAAALTVPGVTAARAVIASARDRTVTGQVQITNATGQAALAAF